MKRSYSLILICFLAVGFAISAAAQAKVERETFSGVPLDHKLDSKLMGREMPYRIVVPIDYFFLNNTKKYSVVYLLHGLTGHFDNWTDKTNVAEYAGRYDVLIVTPEGADGWYTDSAGDADEKYESYLIKELIPEIDKNFRTAANREHRAIAGLSMGGYGALKFGLKYPDSFVLAGSFSGAFDAPSRGLGGKKTWPSIMSVYGKDGSETRRSNDIFAIAKSLNADGINKLPFIYFDCGTEDLLFATNRNFADLLIEKKIPHEFRQLPGGHTWPYWEKQAAEFFKLANEAFAK